MRLIDADILYVDWYDSFVADDGTEYDNIPFISKGQIDDTPTIDAVEVVRCKECRRRYSSDRSKFCIGRHDDFFCAAGVKHS